MKLDARTMLRWLRRALMPMFLIALVYVVYGVFAQFDRVAIAISRTSLFACAYGLIAAMAAMAARVVYRLVLYELAGYGAEVLPRSLAMQSFAWGQMLRYLPGKISGPAAEAAMLERYVPWKSLLRVSIFETFSMMLLSLFWLVASGLYLFGLFWPSLVCLSGGISLVWYLHRRRPWLRHPERSEAAANSVLSLIAVTALVAEWIFFYLIWMAVAGSTWFVSATAYAAASWMAVAVLVAPAGLGVRELIFTELVPHLAPIAKADLLGQAIILRVLLTAADILLPLALLARHRGLINDRS